MAWRTRSRSRGGSDITAEAPSEGGDCQFSLEGLFLQNVMRFSVRGPSSAFGTFSPLRQGEGSQLDFCLCGGEKGLEDAISPWSHQLVAGSDEKHERRSIGELTHADLSCRPDARGGDCASQEEERRDHYGRRGQSHLP